MPLSDAELTSIAEDLIQELPDDLYESLENVSIVIQDWPTQEQKFSAGIGPGGMLLGLYQGVPLPQRSVFQPMVYPASIVLFRKNIERIALTPLEVKAQFRATLFHEIGHHLGFDEDDLRKRGL